MGWWTAYCRGPEAHRWLCLQVDVLEDVAETISEEMGLRLHNDANQGTFDEGADGEKGVHGSHGWALQFRVGTRFPEQKWDPKVGTSFGSQMAGP